MYLSKEFLIRLKLSRWKQYQIAKFAGLHHTSLSRLVNGIERIKTDDPRIVSVGAVLGLSPSECFDQESK